MIPKSPGLKRHDGGRGQSLPRGQSGFRATLRRSKTLGIYGGEAAWFSGSRRVSWEGTEHGRGGVYGAVVAKTLMSGAGRWEEA